MTSLDMNKNVIDINKGKEKEEPKKDAIDYYIDPYIEHIGVKIEEAKEVGLVGTGIAHAAIREFCLQSNFFFSNSAYAVILVVANIKDKKTFLPDKSEQFRLPPFISDKRYGLRDHVFLGKSIDESGGDQCGPAVVTKVEHYLYSDNGGVLTLTKSFIDDEDGYNGYIEAVKKRLSKSAQPQAEPQDQQSDAAEKSE